MVKQIQVEVVYASKAAQFTQKLMVSVQANVAMAIKASDLLSQYPELLLEQLIVGIYAKKCALDSPLFDGDRIEVYRPLEIDPMTARRNRAANRSKKLE